MHFLWWILVGLVAGWITGKIMGGGHGVFFDILLGIAGGIVGGRIMEAIGFARHGGLIYTILVAIGGAVLLTWIYRLVSRHTRGKPSDHDQGRGGGDWRAAA